MKKAKRRVDTSVDTSRHACLEVSTEVSTVSTHARLRYPRSGRFQKLMNVTRKCRYPLGSTHARLGSPRRYPWVSTHACVDTHGYLRGYLGSCASSYVLTCTYSFHTRSRPMPTPRGSMPRHVENESCHRLTRHHLMTCTWSSDY